MKVVALNEASGEKWENLVNADGSFEIVVDAMQGDAITYTFSDSVAGRAAVTLPIPTIVQSSLLEGPPKTVDRWGETPGGPAALHAVRQQRVAGAEGREGLAAGVRGLKKVVAVAQFRNKAIPSASSTLGDAMRDQLVHALKRSGRFVVREQELLTAVFGEQDLARSGRTAEGEAARAGRVVSAQYLVRGTVSEVEVREVSGHTGFSLYGSGKLKARSRVHMAVIIDLIDTTSGVVVASQRMVGKAEARAERTDVSFSGIARFAGTAASLAGTYVPFIAPLAGIPDVASTAVSYAGAFVPSAVGGYSSGSQKRDPQTRAMQACIDNAVYFIALELEKRPWKSRVVKVSDGDVTIRGGEGEGIRPGLEFAVRREKEPTRDPATGEVLDVESVRIARIRVEKVKGQVSVCRALDGGEIEVGDSVILE